MQVNDPPKLAFQQADARERPAALLPALARTLRRSLLILAGATVLLAGIVMIVTPGPAIVFIPVGMAMLGVKRESLRKSAKRIRGRARRFLRNAPLKLSLRRDRSSPSRDNPA